MIKKWLISVILMHFASNSFASGPISGTILDISSTFKTLSIDLGDLDAVKEGDFAKLVVQRGDFHTPKLFLAGDIKAVKTFPNKSIWLVEKNYFITNLKNNDKILLMTVDHVVDGRETKISLLNRVYNKNSYQSDEDFANQNKNNIPDSMIYNQNEFEKDEIYREKNAINGQKKIVTYGQLKANGSSRFLDDYNEEVSGLTYVESSKFQFADLKNAEDMKLLVSDTNGLIEKYNSEKLPLQNGLYRYDSKISGSKDISDDLSVNNTYLNSKESKNAKEELDPGFIAKVKKDGQLWSADMDDATLRRYMINTGIIREKLRRQYSANESDGHEIFMNYTGNTNTHVTSGEQDSNYQLYGRSLVIGYDLHLSKTPLKWKTGSVQFFVEMGNGYYDVNNVNGKMSEGSYGTYLNYYFYNNPLISNFPIGYIGIGMKVGAATMTTPYFDGNYTYQILTLPSLQLMGKYRFHVGDLTEDTLNVGLACNFGFVYENKKLKLATSTSNNVASNINVDDLKLQLGFSFFF